jgi:hypothetical protein
MTIYVQSRGKSQEHDHCWLEIRKDAPPSFMPPELKKLETEELIDSQKPSIILARSGKYLVLLIMALETGDGRIDFMGRQIRNSVAWVEIDSSEKDRLLRKIAIQALNGTLAAAVDEAVSSDDNSDFGFKADFTKLKTIGKVVDDSCEYEPKSDSEPANPYPLKVGGDNKDLKFELIAELAENALPKFSGNIQILVVATTMKSSEGLRKKGVWRGISSRIESKDWEFDISRGEELDLKDDKKKLLFGVVIMILVSIIAIIIWVLVNHPTSRNLKPERITPVQSIGMQTTSQITSEPLQQ